MLAYQQALCDMIASPELCLRVRQGAQALAPYDLSARERDRLVHAARQRGMSTSCTLHRVNRITPIYNYLPFTCALLGDDLMGEAERYWSEGKPGDLQFHPEILRFAAFLLRRIAEGAIANAYIDDVLRYELAMNELRWGIEPALRLISFAHAPEPLLTALADRKCPAPGSIPSGSHQVVIDARDGEIRVSVVTEDLADDITDDITDDLAEAV
jgi:hypothetical protein